MTKPGFGGPVNPPKVGVPGPGMGGGPKFPPKVGAPVMGGVSQPVEKVEPPQPQVDYQPIYDTVARGMELLAQIEVGI